MPPETEPKPRLCMSQRDVLRGVSLWARVPWESGRLLPCVRKRGRLEWLGGNVATVTDLVLRVPAGDDGVKWAARIQRWLERCGYGGATVEVAETHDA